ncbi:MAG: methyltransferase domain-containing protein [Nitrospirae bacterium]|nr:methyltransferase domain-containing protein [Nitrospirota bacterium]
MKWDAEMYDSAKSPQTDAGRELIALAKVREDDSILDLGCGAGRLTIELAKLAHKGNIVGIDPSQDMLGRAREKASSMDNILLLNIPAQDLDLKEEFDLVFSNSAFQWIKEQEDVIARAYGALKPNGRIAVQMPAKDFCWTMTENIHSAIAALGLEKKYNKMESPWRFPLKEEMHGFFRDAGFVNIDVFYKDYMLLFEGVNEVLEWGVSAGLRPFLAPLSKKKQERFKYAFAMGFENYRTEKGIEFSFRRLFAFAEK